MLATIGPGFYDAGSDETNVIRFTTDGEWLILEEETPNFLGFVPGAINPDFLESLTVTITGDENNHDTMIVGECIQAAPAGPCIFAPGTTFITKTSSI